MSKKPFFLMFLAIILMGVLGASFNVHKVEAPYPTIYIKADGSIDPSTANITSPDNVTYTFTADINASIVVEKNNTVVDGAGYTVQGVGGGTGIDLSYRNNVTLKNVEVTNFTYGIYLSESTNNTLSGNTASNNGRGIGLYYSSNNTVTGNTASSNHNGISLGSSSNNTISGNNASSNNNYGILLGSSSNNNTVTGNNASSNNEDGISLSESTNNTVSGNNASSNNDDGISLSYSTNNNIIGNNASSNGYEGILIRYSSNNTVSGNTASSNNEDGIYLYSSSNNTVSGNTASNNTYGIELFQASDNAIYHNNFIDNTNQALVSAGYTNIWDDGAGEGNYWSDYEEKYPNATEIDGSGIWDTPYVIDENNQDNYPIVPEFPSFLILPLFMAATLLAVIIIRRKHKANLRIPV